MTRAQEIATIIKQQIFAAPKGRMSIAYSWGPNGFLCGDKVNFALGCDESGGCTSTFEIPSLGWLRFNVNGRLFKGMVYVVLAPSDTYTVLLVENKKKKINKGVVSISMPYCELKSETSYVYADQLVRTIDELVETPTA